MDADSQGGIEMVDLQKEELMAELGRMKREMVDIVYGSGYEIVLDSGRVLTINS
jgi:hypothetical protein